jgi:hypothetical protein
VVGVEVGDDPRQHRHHLAGHVLHPRVSEQGEQHYCLKLVFGLFVVYDIHNKKYYCFFCPL